jgi:Card1-like, endonuclease domain
MAQEWPHQFVYVCNATFANIVNFAPIVHAGADRIERVVIFRGFDANKQHPTDVAQAKKSADALRNVVKRHFEDHGRKDFVVTVGKYDGDPERMDVWARHIETLLQKVRETPIVYCMSGGTKLMSRGVVLGGGDRIKVVHTTGKTLRTQFIEGLNQVDAAQHGVLGLVERLGIQNYRELDWMARVQTEIFYRDAAPQIEQFADTYLERPELAGSLNTATEGLWQERPGRKKKSVPGAIDISRTDPDVGPWLRELFGSLDGMPGFKKESDSAFAAETDRAAKLLHGGWLEAYLYNRIRVLARPYNDVEVGANVVCTAGNDPASEIDVALLIGGQLHAIEAKTADLGTEEMSGSTIRQAQNLKTNLLGQPGRIMIVNPRVTRDGAANARGDLLIRARNAGVELYLGVEAVDKALTIVRDLLSAPR